MILNLEAIRSAAVRWSPYPYFALTGALMGEAVNSLAEAFPRISSVGAIAVEETVYGPPFGKLIDELRSDAFRAIIADKFNVELDHAPTVIEVRGKTRWTDGNIHTDTPSKLVTVLIYFNAPGQADATGLRILRGSKDIEDFAEEISPLLGNMVVFKVTSNCWHGHKPFVGERYSLQLNYLSGVQTIWKHQLLHRLWSRAKRKLLQA